jgi:putative N6-adenine-specific DNA methylase
VTESYFATTARGLEEITAQELTKLGAKDVKTDFTGVHFTGDQRLLYKVNLWGRTIFRVLQTIKTVKAKNRHQLYQQVQKINWSKYIQPEQTLSVRATGENQELNHTHFTALQIKDAIVDQQMQYTGKRSSVDTDQPNICINAHIHEDSCILSLDSTGESLHRRGYRPAVGLAPLKETLAAALLYLTEWEGDRVLYDPFCGSGTILLEAALLGLNIAPGLSRDFFLFQNWADFDEQLWEELLEEAEKAQKNKIPPIIGSDVDADIVRQAQKNAKICHLDRDIEIYQRHLVDIQPPAPSGIILCNPPYGKRIADTESLFPLYKLLGDILKQRFQGWTAYIFSGNKELTKKIGLRTSRRVPIDNGGIPCTLLKYELY